MKKFIFSFILAVAFCGIAQAQQKIATVDIAAVMMKYQKAVELRTRLEGDAKNAQSARDEKIQKLQGLRGEAEALFKQTKDPILNEQGRKDVEAKLQAKAAELQQFEREATQQMQTTLAALQSRDQANVKQLFDDIRPTVAALAKEKGFDVVMPLAGLLYADPALDITEEIVKRLNAAFKPETPAK